MIKKYFDKKVILFFISLIFMTKNIFAISFNYDEVYISNFLENQLFFRFLKNNC
jgi:hypothetical protein